MTRRLGNTKLGEYNHLDDTDPLIVKVNLQKLAMLICNMNYGVHRLLSAIVFNRLDTDPDDPLAHEIKKILDQGYY